MARLIADGSRNEIEARLLSCLHYLGDAMIKSLGTEAVQSAVTAIDALIGSPLGEESAESLAEKVARLLGEQGEKRDRVYQRGLQSFEMRRELLHHLYRPISPRERAETILLAFSLMRTLLDHGELISYADLQALIARG
jgi:hypothetical protein